MDLLGKKTACTLALDITHVGSPWWVPVTSTPRHHLVRNWFTRSPQGWNVTNGTSDPQAWARAAYSDTELVTRIGPVHADHAAPDQPIDGSPTSASSAPGMIVRMLKHARLTPGLTLLDVGTGCGYSAALACCRVRSANVTTMDIDPHLTQTAAQRLGEIGHHPNVVTGDATGPKLPDTYDRIVSTTAVPGIPAAWLTALNPGGRLVTTLAETTFIITADKTPDGGATGRVELDRAKFTPTHATEDYPPALNDVYAAALHDEGEVSESPMPLLDVTQTPDIHSMLALQIPGIKHRTEVRQDGTRITLMLHPNGSWARAYTRRAKQITKVHQAGPARLYDALEEVRWQLACNGSLPVHGARVTIKPDGETTFTHHGWSLTL